MKDAVKCLACGTTYPPELVTEWGRNEASAGMGPTPRCPAVVPNPHARKAINRDNQQEQPEHLCGGILGPTQVADSVKLEDVRPFGRAASRTYPGFWRQRSADRDES